MQQPDQPMPRDARTGTTSLPGPPTQVATWTKDDDDVATCPTWTVNQSAKDYSNRKRHEMAAETLQREEFLRRKSSGQNIRPGNVI